MGAGRWWSAHLQTKEPHYLLGKVAFPMYYSILPENQCCFELNTPDSNRMAGVAPGYLMATAELDTLGMVLPSPLWLPS